jgi:uncharacterized integral membrane protein (TIGR00698 family)
MSQETNVAGGRILGFGFGPWRIDALAPLIVVAATSWFIGQRMTLLGPAAVALVLGAVVQALLPFGHVTKRRFAAIGTRLLQASIILLGGSIGLVQIFAVAGVALPVMLATVFGGLALIWLIGGRLAIPARRKGLLAVGTSICGASAIAAAAPALGATPGEVTYAVSVVFLFNFAAVILFPLIAHMSNMAPEAFAVWAGTAINDTSSVLAASVGFGSSVVAAATVVKLSRTVMILPVTVVVAIVSNGGEMGTPHRHTMFNLLRRAVPWFAVWFVIAATLNSMGLVPDSVGQAVGTFAGLGVIGALAGVGLATDAAAIREAGVRPLILAAVGWVSIAALSLVVQGMTGLL